MKHTIKLLWITFLLFYPTLTKAQIGFLQLSNAQEQKYQHELNNLNSKAHTSLKPFLIRDLKENTSYDSLNKPYVKDSKFNNSLVGRKLFKEHLFTVSDTDYVLFLSPVFEFLGGQDQEANKNYLTNSRGVWAGGSIGKRFSFNATFYENQSTFPRYLDSTVNKTRIVPGTGRIKKTDGYDYAWATGSLNFELNKHFTFQFGNDKNFIGDGYRSILLSDNAFFYPSFKIITDVWKIRNTNIFAEMQDLTRIDQGDNEPFLRKFTSMHYLDINLGKRASIGIFEAVVWHGDSSGTRNFDLGYMNPFIFFRPVEFSIGSPDNVLLGLNGKYKLSSNYLLYGQIMLDEFLLDEVKAGDGWWANKQGWQIGAKGFNVFGVKNLYLQAEYNAVRPFTYSHRDVQGNYGHYRQALAHPLGANFYEVVGIARYDYKHLRVEGKINYAVVGYDTAGTNLGQNIFLPYGTRAQEYSNEIGQGDQHKIMWLTMSVYYEINPITHFSVFLEPSIRNDQSPSRTTNTVLIQGGLKTRLFNRYFDF